MLFCARAHGLKSEISQVKNCAWHWICSSV